MSTNISPAFLLSSDADVFKVSEGLRAVLVPRLIEDFQKETVNHAVRKFDRRENADSTEPFNRFFSQHLIHLGRSLFGAGDKMDRFDENFFTRISDFNGIIFRNPVRGEKYLLCSDDVLDKDGIEAVLSVDGIEGEFSYHNSTDSQLDYLTYEEWQDRRDAWNETLDWKKGLQSQGMTVKFLSGSSYELLNYDSYVAAEKALLPSAFIEDRFRMIVMDLYFSELVKVIPDLDILRAMNRSWKFLNANYERDYSKLWKADEHQSLVEEVVTTAERRVSEFPLIFGNNSA